MNKTRTLAKKSHGLGSADASPRKLGCDRNAGRVEAFAQSDLVKKSPPFFSRPSAGMETVRRIPGVNVSVAYQLFDERNKARVQGRCVNLPGLGSECDPHSLQVNVLVKIHPAFCEAVALLATNLKGDMEHFPHDLALYLGDVLANLGIIGGSQFRLTLRIVLADSQPNAWICVHKLTIHCFTHDNTEQMQFTQGGIVAGMVAPVGIGQPPWDIIEASLPGQTLRAADLASDQEQADGLPTVKHSSQSFGAVAIASLKPAIHPGPAVAATIPLASKTGEFFCGALRFESASLADFSRELFVMPESGGFIPAQTVAVREGKPEILGIGSDVKIRHVIPRST